jgi:tetratricopeptide (TPR) repeat protein
MLFAFVFSQSIRLSTKNILVSYGFFKWMAAFLMTVCLLGNYFYVVSDFYYQRGINSLMRNEKNISKIFFENSFENNKNNWDAALALAFLAFDQKDEIRMNQYLEKALSIRQDINTVKISSQMWFKIGSEKAIPGYKLLTRVFPEHLTPWAHLAQMAFKQKRYKEARQYAEHILKIQPRLKSTSYDFNRQVAHDILRSIPNSSVIKEPL